LKTGFTAAAVSAARYRAYAVRAEQDGLPNLAARWRHLAEEKDRLAEQQLGQAGQVKEPARSLKDALASERYENDVLYPRMLSDVEGETAETLESVMAAQKRHIADLEEIREALQASQGDV
jgi:rubrerythrin